MTSDEDQRLIDGLLHAAAESDSAAGAAEEAAHLADVAATTRRTIDSQAKAQALRSDAEMARREADAAQASADAFVRAVAIKTADEARVSGGQTTIEVDPDGVVWINYSTLPPELQDELRRRRQK